MIVYRYYEKNCNSNDDEICKLLNTVNELVSFIFYIQEFPEYDFGFLFNYNIIRRFELFKKVIIYTDEYGVIRYGFFQIPNVFTKREVCAYLNGIYYGLTFNNGATM